MWILGPGGQEGGTGTAHASQTPFSFPLPQLPKFH